MESITFHNSLKNIGYCGFFYCDKLKSISFPSSLITIGRYAFYHCTLLETVTFSGSSLKSIGQSAFDSCSSLSSIIIPESITEIGSFAFRSCSNLNNFQILNPNIKDIGAGMLCNLDGLIYSLPTSLQGSKWANYLTDVYGESFEIPDDMKNLIDYACAELSHLKSITIPNSVENIGDHQSR